MKRFIALLLLVLAPMSFASDRFGGLWKHYYVKAENVEIRLSYKESYVAATYGLHKGGRVARNIHIDAWGHLYGKTVDYSLKNSNHRAYSEEITGTLIRNSESHQYDKLSLANEYIWLEGNERFTQDLKITIDGRDHHFQFSL